MAYKNQKKNKLKADQKRRQNRGMKAYCKRENKIDELVKSGIPRVFAKRMV